MITYTNLISLPILLYLLSIFLALQLCKGSQFVFWLFLQCYFYYLELCRQEKNILTSLKYRFYVFLYTERETSLNLGYNFEEYWFCLELY